MRQARQPSRVQPTPQTPKNRKSVLAILSLQIDQMAYWLIILYIYAGTGRTANVNVRYFSIFLSESY
jgi:hypothetical protein